MLNKKVSIIVAIYNIEEYIEECINSLLNQTYENIEIILVDDGSTDKSGAICDKYASAPQNIKVIHKKNRGLSEARNIGILEATGEYITFVDGDDWVDKTAIRTLVWLLEENKADVSSIIRNGHQFSSGEVIIGDGKRMLLHMLNTVCFESWGKLYKKSLFDNIKFPEGKICEDLYSLPSIMLKSNKIVVYHKGLYYYRKREDSITSMMYKNNFYDLVECCLEGIKNIALLTNDKELILNMQRWYLYHILWYYYNVMFNYSDDYKKAAEANVYLFYRKTRSIFLKNPKVKLTDKIRFLKLSFGIKS